MRSMSISEQTTIISLYNINWLVFIAERERVYCTVRNEHLTFTNCTFCPNNVFMCFVEISEETGIISLHSINRLVFFITEAECVYCAVGTESLQVNLKSPTSVTRLQWHVQRARMAHLTWGIALSRRSEVGLCWLVSLVCKINMEG
jgi:hypothetical protein